MDNSVGHRRWHSNWSRPRVYATLIGVKSLDDAASRYHLAQEEIDMARFELIEAIREARNEGMRQVDIVKATGWTREQIRRVCRG